MTARVKICYIDYIRSVSMTMSFPNLNHKRSISKLQSAVIDHCRAVCHYDEDDGDTIIVSRMAAMPCRYPII